MRTAAICPTCATYENAVCVLYNGPFLPTTNIQPLDNLEDAVEKIETAFTPLNGAGVPTNSASFIGQLYVNTSGPSLYYAKSVGLGGGDWVRLTNY